MSIFDNMRDKFLSYFNAKDKLDSEFIQHHHEVGECVHPCFKCLNNDLRIFANDGLMFYTETHNEREVIQIK